MPTHPQICVCIAENEQSSRIELVKKFSFCELRTDLIKIDDEELKELYRINSNIILSFRKDTKSEAEQIERIKLAANMGGSYIDIDEKLGESLIKKAKDIIKGKKTQLIVSHHNEESTPSLKILIETLSKLKETKADIIKIVTKVNSLEEATKVLQLYFDKNNIIEKNKLIAFAMGEEGDFTRVSAFHLGAPFTYCAATEPIAEGQYSYDKMYNLLFPAHTFHIPKENHEELLETVKSSNLMGAKTGAIRGISVPCSKSMAIRAIICGAFAEGETIIRNFETCDDIRRTVLFARKCGCICKTEILPRKNHVYKILIIRSPGFEKWKRERIIKCGESALLARIAMAIYALPIAEQRVTYRPNKFFGEGTLSERNLHDLYETLTNAGIGMKYTDSKGNYTSEKPADNKAYLPMQIDSGKCNREIHVDGSKTSETVTALLLTLPLLSYDTKLVVKNAVSVPYIDMTCSMLNLFGVEMEYRRDGNQMIFNIRGNQKYQPLDIYLQPDWSAAANFAVAGTIASSYTEDQTHFTIRHMVLDSGQADEEILTILKSSGAEIVVDDVDNPDKIPYLSNSRTGYYTYDTVSHVNFSAESLKSFSYNLIDSPDLFPIVSVLATKCEGVSKIKGLNRLVNKESNRAKAILQEFHRDGIQAYVDKNVLIVHGERKRAEEKKEIHYSSHNDHRIAMALIVKELASNTTTNATIDNIECINKTFPAFINKILMKYYY